MRLRDLAARSRDDIRVRVTATATAAALVVGLVGALLFAISLHKDLERSLVNSTRQQVQTISAQLKSGSPAKEVTVTSRNDVITQVLDRSGSIVGTDHPKLATPLRTTPGVSEGVHAKGLSDTYVVVAERVEGGQLVVVAHSDEEVARALRTTVLLLAFSVPLGLATLVVAVWIAIGQALRPVEAMRKQAAGITSAHSERRLTQPPGSDEIARLAGTLNSMLDRIESSQRAQRQFISDASHELRSPLAAMRQMAEVALRYPSRTTVATLGAEVLAEERRMEGLATSLLTLAKLEDREGGRQEVVDLDDVVLEEVRRARELEPSGCEVRIDAIGVGAGQVSGDPILLSQMARNLLSNAIRHSRSLVRVTLREEAETVRLEVADDGDGIAPEHRSSIFGRFVRLDEARARDAGGSGLGLAIVTKVVQTTGGVVTIDDAPEGGAQFSVLMPRAGIDERAPRTR